MIKFSAILAAAVLVTSCGGGGSGTAPRNYSTGAASCGAFTD
jgi:hypothetical protein